MGIPTFNVELAEGAGRKTLADIPEWTLAECEYAGEYSYIRFRVGELAYGGGDSGDPPLTQDPACEYTVKRIVGQIICK